MVTRFFGWIREAFYKLCCTVLSVIRRCVGSPSLAKKRRCLLVVDFECTCDKQRKDWIHEIIEFPVLCVDVEALKTTEVFHRFVKPTERPTLTRFCTELTGISQATVDSAAPLDVVLEEFETWRAGVTENYAFVADGPSDFRDFLLSECARKRIAPPLGADRWVDLGEHLRTFYGVTRGTLQAKLERLGLEFEGRPHSGLDDARNIAAIAIKLARDRCPLEINDNWGISRDINLSRRCRRTPIERRQAKDRLKQTRSRRVGRRGPTTTTIQVEW
ncbi:hypothetical protein CTAYLR_004923 [Chrysophaeum taylorii]|uniref:Exonuclease domain-containing protein n=1 Tax=Chrysophaeum taylorii TaxID=2483200 RepID=A0AAD7XRU4_9STRA|nr:hypothetical protein CTAYLR_004923 [Chrysophaeum taylorii]